MNIVAEILLPAAVLGMFGLIFYNLLLHIRLKQIEDRKLVSDIDPANFVRMRQELLDAIDNRLRKFEKQLAEARTLRDELGLLRETIQSSIRNQVSQPELHPINIMTTSSKKAVGSYENKPTIEKTNIPAYKDEVVIQSQTSPAARVVVVQQPTTPQPNAGKLNAPFSMQSTGTLTNPVHRAIAKELAAGTPPEAISAKLNVSAGEVELVAKIIKSNKL